MLCSFLLEFALVLPVLRVALAAPVAETSNALAPRFNPNPPEPVICSPSQLKCTHACCDAGSSCHDGYCAPKIGSIEVSHYTDAQGNPGMIAISGTGFKGTADVLIQVWGSSTITDVFLQTNVPGPSWYFETGVQDCTQDGQSTGATDGDVAYIWAADNYLTNLYNYVTDTPRVTVRAMATGGLCPRRLRLSPIYLDITTSP